MGSRVDLRCLPVCVCVCALHLHMGSVLCIPPVFVSLHGCTHREPPCCCAAFAAGLSGKTWVTLRTVQLLLMARPLLFLMGPWRSAAFCSPNSQLSICPSLVPALCAPSVGAPYVLCVMQVAYSLLLHAG